MQWYGYGPQDATAEPDVHIPKYSINIGEASVNDVERPPPGMKLKKKWGKVERKEQSLRNAHSRSKVYEATQ